jgi:NAD(P)-dependent dehydrogenase (short-subunit alcohol dehydrogenase family)
MEKISLEGKYAIVTGSSRGIGRAIAKALSREGAGVVLVSRAADTLLSVREEIQSAGGRAIAVPADVSREEDTHKIVEMALKEFGKVDILVNNAAIAPHDYYYTPLVETPVEIWDRIMSINLRGVFLCIKAVLPRMIEQRGGSIVNVSSIAGTRAGKGRIAYGVSKAGLERLSFGLADEVREFNISVNVVAPVGVTDTTMARETFTTQSPDRWVKPEDVAEAAVWLARQEAATFTGKAIMVPAHHLRTAFVYGRGSEDRPFTIIE